MRNFLLGIIAVCMVGILAVGIIYVRGAIQAPLAEPMALTVSTSTPAPQQPATTVPPTATTAPQLTCGQTGAMTILMVGHDDNYWVYPAGADSVRLVKVDFDQKKVTLFAFPRDLLVNTPSLTAKYNVSTSKLGTVYATVRKAEGSAPDADLKAVTAIAQTIYDNFGLVSDHYLTPNEAVLVQVIDTLGGVEVNVAKDFKTPPGAQPALSLKSGTYRMDGNTAMVYMRVLTSTPDEWDRLSRQNAVLQGLFQKMEDPSVVTKIPALYSQFKAALTTDLSLDQITSLTCLAKLVSEEDIHIDTFKTDTVRIENGSTIVLNDPTAAKEMLQSLFQVN